MNRASYNAIATQWDLARSAFCGREREYLDTFLAGWTASLILDAGCGTGRPMAEYVLKRGHHIVGIDQADELLAMAKMRLPSEKWINATLEEYAFAEQYQGVICWDSLFHLDRSHHVGILTRIANCLPLGGRLMLTIGGSEHAAFTDQMFGHEFFYDSLAHTEVLRILASLGFVTLVSEFMNLPTTGRDKGRFAIVAEKAR